MLIWWTLLSLAFASDNLLLEYGDIRFSTDDLEQRYWAVPDSARKTLFANRKSTETALEGMLYDAIASGRLENRDAIYETEAYKAFLARVRKKMEVPDLVTGREGLLQWFEARGQKRGFELEENKWLAQYWLNQQLLAAADEKKLETMALEKFILSGKSMDAWEEQREQYIERVKADVLRRKRLEIWSELVDRSKIKTYPDHFEAFLRKHAPKPSAVEGPLSQKP